MRHTLIAVCKNGHSQTLQYKDLPLEFVVQQAGLLDGTSPFYVHSPIGTDSVIGKCGICGTQISCTVSTADTNDSGGTDPEPGPSSPPGG